MASGGKKLITKRGLEKLKAELKKRKNVLRSKIADKLDEAKALGDLSENAAYTGALEEYQLNETKINELEEQILSLEVAPNKSGDLKIDIGDKIILEDRENGKTIEYSIVGEGEGDPSCGQISVNSPVGKALAGKVVGEIVKISLVGGDKEYKILEVK